MIQEKIYRLFFQLIAVTAAEVVTTLLNLRAYRLTVQCSVNIAINVTIFLRQTFPSNLGHISQDSHNHTFAIRHWYGRFITSIFMYVWLKHPQLGFPRSLNNALPR